MNLKKAFLISLVAFGFTIVSFIAFIFTTMLAVLGRSSHIASFFMILLILSVATIFLAPICSLIESCIKRFLPETKKYDFGIYMLVASVGITLLLIAKG